MGVVSIVEEPSGVVSAYDDQLVKIIAEDATSTGIIIMTVFRNRGDGDREKIGELTQQFYRNTTYFQFNLMPLVREAVTYDNPQESSSQLLIDENNSAAAIYFTAKHYELSSGSYALQGSQVNTAYVAVNTALLEDESISDYIISTSGQKEFLTRQKTQVVHEGEQLQFHFLTDLDNTLLKGVLTAYTAAGSSSSSNVSLTSFSRQTKFFYGIDGSTLTSSPSMTSSDPTSTFLRKVTDSNGIDRIGIEIADTEYVQFSNGGVTGKAIKMEVYALSTGDIDVVFNSATGTDTLTIAAVGYSELTTVNIPAGTVSVRFTNSTGERLLISYMDIVTAAYDEPINNRCIMYIDEPDMTKAYYELYVSHNSARVSEILRINVKQGGQGKRLKWLSKRGTIEHYTFTCYNNATTQAEKTKILTGEGFKTVDSIGQKLTTVYSHFETSDGMKWLSEIVESPFVWLVVSKTEEYLVDVVTGSFPADGKALRQGSVTFRDKNYRKVQAGD